MKNQDIDKIAYIIGNPLLAADIFKSIEMALETPFVNTGDRKNVWEIFKNSLDAAIRDIQNHPRGELFQRLIKYGLPNPDEPEKLESDGKTILSDPECGECAEFIYSFMINRFKGELAELLALEQCITLITNLQKEKLIPANAKYYWGGAIKEKMRIKNKIEKDKFHWGDYALGADSNEILHDEDFFEKEIKLKFVGLTDDPEKTKIEHGNPKDWWPREFDNEQKARDWEKNLLSRKGYKGNPGSEGWRFGFNYSIVDENKK